MPLGQPVAARCSIRYTQCVLSVTKAADKSGHVPESLGPVNGEVPRWLFPYLHAARPLLGECFGSSRHRNRSWTQWRLNLPPSPPARVEAVHTGRKFMSPDLTSDGCSHFPCVQCDVSWVGDGMSQFDPSPEVRPNDSAVPRGPHEPLIPHAVWTRGRPLLRYHPRHQTQQSTRIARKGSDGVCPRKETERRMSPKGSLKSAPSRVTGTTSCTAQTPQPMPPA